MIKHGLVISTLAAYSCTNKLKTLITLPLLLISALLMILPTWANENNNDRSCYVDGLSDRLRCGYINVPENYAKPDGTQIQIHYLVLPAIKSSFPKEALLAIAGGPGQSAIENAAGFERMFTKVRQQRDILLIDQRGTGQSNQLQCENEHAKGLLSLNEADLDIQAETLRCLDAIDADVTQYGSAIALKDFEAVRTHLNYQKLHVYGISYGTRMAQLYMRHYPQVLATVTLDGVVPMQQSVLHIGDAIERSIKLLFEDCNNNKLCQQQFPQLAEEFNQINQQLSQRPIIEEVRDPLTNEPTQLTMTQTKFMGSVRMALYSSNVRALLPHAIHQAAQGNFQTIMGLYALTVDSTGIAMGMHSSVVCGEDWQRFQQQTQQEDSNYFTNEMLKGINLTCPIWNMPAVDKHFSEAIESNIPTLVLSGHIDPATPPSWGELAMEKLTNAKHFIAPYASHGVAYQSCANDLITQLINETSIDKLSEECLSKDVSRNFYLNANTVEQINNPNSQSSRASEVTNQGVAND